MPSGLSLTTGRLEGSARLLVFLLLAPSESYWLPSTVGCSRRSSQAWTRLYELAFTSLPSFTNGCWPVPGKCRDPNGSETVRGRVFFCRTRKSTRQPEGTCQTGDARGRVSNCRTDEVDRIQ